MEIKKSTLQNLGITITVLLMLGIVVFLFTQGKSEPSPSTQAQPITLTGDEQVISITAKAGYSPRVIEAKANTDTVLKIITKNTFDCSSALRIPKLGISKNLPVTGETVIPIAAQKAGTEIDGTCSMGMYNFTIKFV